MKTSDFYYDLPKELIAQFPLEHRDESRLLVLHRDTGEIEHKTFRNVIDYLNKGDCLVLNETKVIPARIYGKKEGTNGVVELLLVKKISDGRYECLVKPGKNAKIGQKLHFDRDDFHATVEDIIEDGMRIVKFDYEGIFEEILDELGTMPLPPYITQKLEEQDRYQTVYAKIPGSAAAPTAGLHFTTELLEEIKNKGINIAKINLEVGLGTFRPVKVDNVEGHKMHTERFSIEADQAEIINKTRKEGGRIISVGTTVCRTLESVADESGFVKPISSETSIFIYPGYKFKAIDGLITNFHLPESTLIMLVSAFSGKENIMRAYQEAIDRKYRFFSFGDATLLI